MRRRRERYDIRAEIARRQEWLVTERQKVIEKMEVDRSERQRAAREQEDAQSAEAEKRWHQLNRERDAAIDATRAVLAFREVANR